uniref:Phospholipid-transporting ATPase n=1 Tax=Compsopogon caeruleus TaxID=31354 RepID=A0A7S1TDZ2_9RHOD
MLDAEGTSMLAEVDREVRPSRPGTGVQDLSGARVPSETEASARRRGGRARRGGNEPEVRKVWINPDEDHARENRRFPTNYISTTKYSPWNLLPKFLFEQFTLFSNAYFLAVGCLYAVDKITPVFTGGRYSTLWTLTVVIVVAFVKDVWEDLNRLRSDRAVNRHATRRLAQDGDEHVQDTTWARVHVGDILRIEKDEAVPADMVILACSSDDGVAYIETKQLDGESNLKVKVSIPDVSDHFDNIQGALETRGYIDCEAPNELMYRFNGSITILQGEEEVVLPLSYENFLLRGCTLRNTEYVLGVVVNTGRETKLMMNIKPAPRKRSTVEKKTSYYYFVPFTMQIVFCSILAVLSRSECRRLPIRDAWYFAQPDENCAFLPSFLRFFTYFLTFSSMIPIALNIFIEIARVFHTIQVSSDGDMIDESTGTKSEARTSNLTTELGQVSYVFSDKTGTLTANRMVFKKCSVGGVVYGWDLDDAATSSKVLPVEKLSSKLHDQNRSGNLEDVIGEEFFKVLSICHAVVPEPGPDGQSVIYQSSSPDEVALATFAKAQGFEFASRSNKEIFVQRDGHEEAYEILGVIDFDSTRKRMSVIVRGPDAKVKVYTKGADSVILSRLAPGQSLNKAKDDIGAFAVEGLRTLALAYRQVDDAWFDQWSKRYAEARGSLTDREREVEVVADEIERALTFVGVTAIEDKLQDGVPDTLRSLRQAGIAIWILTGDKQETAINIGLSSGTFDEDMDIVIINEHDVPGTSAQIDRALGRWTALAVETEGLKKYGLVIDGATLHFALAPELETKFINLTRMAKSVVGCRLSPKQKSEIVDCVRRHEKGKITLGIGDGANDVGMIRAAHIGVGIVGLEGQEARLASDFSIGQFRFLKKLLLVHGRWFYKRITKMALFTIYKNIMLALNDLYWAPFNLFSGQPLLDPWMSGMYNIFFTALSPIALGAFDQELVKDYALTFPEVYRKGPKNTAYNLSKFIAWILTAWWHSALTFFIAFFARADGPRANGQPVGMWPFGVIVYLNVLFTVLFYLWLFQNSWTWLTFTAWILSIIAVFLFLGLFCLFSLSTNTSPPMNLVVQVLWGQPKTWLIILLVVLIACLPRLTLRTYRRSYRPNLKVLVQELQRKRLKREDLEGKDPDKDALHQRRPSVSITRGEESMVFSGFNFEPYVPSKSGTFYVEKGSGERPLLFPRTGSDTKVTVDVDHSSTSFGKHRRAKSDGRVLLP